MNQVGSILKKEKIVAAISIVIGILMVLSATFGMLICLVYVGEKDHNLIEEKLNFKNVMGIVFVPEII